MKALSIRQPWAWLIMQGFKDVENRSWRSNHTGPFLVHTGQNFVNKDEYKRAYRMLYRYDHSAIHRMPSWSNRKELFTGGLLGVVEMKGCLPMHDSHWFEGEPLNAFVLENPTRFDEPIPYKGSQRFFNVDDDVVPAPDLSYFIEE